MKIFTLTIILLFSGWNGYAQITDFWKMEASHQHFEYRTVSIYPASSDWLGYNLKEKPNGMDVNLIYGANIKHHFLVGLGIGYLNFEGINGLSIFANLEYIPLKRRLSPILSVKFGYSHIWNQYKGGTRYSLAEYTGGLTFKATEKLNIYMKSGFLFTQQVLLTPFRIGVRFLSNK